MLQAASLRFANSAAIQVDCRSMAYSFVNVGKTELTIIPLRSVDVNLPDAGLVTQVGSRANSYSFSRVSGFYSSFIPIPGHVAFSEGGSQGSICILASAIACKQGLSIPYLPALARFFGVGARQDSDYIYLEKSSLTGLNALPVNSVESLFAALLLKVTSNESNSLTSKVVVNHYQTNFIVVEGVNVQEDMFQVKFNQALYFTAANELIKPDKLITPTSINS